MPRKPKKSQPKKKARQKQKKPGKKTGGKMSLSKKAVSIEAKKKLLMKLSSPVLRTVLLNALEQEMAARKLAKGEGADLNARHALNLAQVMLLRQTNRFKHQLETSQGEAWAIAKERLAMLEELKETAQGLQVLPGKPETPEGLRQERLFWTEIWEEYRDYFLFKIKGLRPSLRKKLEEGLT